MKKTTKITSVILAIVILFSTLTIVPLSAFAATSGSLSNNVKWSLNGSTLTITGKGRAAMYNDVPWQSQTNNIKKIVVGEGITNMDMSCYSIAPKVEEVQLPSTILSIQSDLFWYSNSLKEVTVYSKNASIAPGLSTISDTTVLYGYSGSTLELYASDYGRTFIDINTNKTTKYTRKNSDLIKLLPTNISCSEPATSGNGISDSSTGIFKGYDAHIAHETDKSKAEYKVLVNKTNEIIKDCKTNMEKTQALANWVSSNLYYGVGVSDALIYNVYNAFENRAGNCMSFTFLLNYMLYIAGIPTATVSTIGHMYSLALVDGKWYDIECTTGQISSDYDRRDTIIDTIAYSNPDLTVMLIQNTRGLTFAGPGWNDLDENKYPDTITIPDNAKLFYKYSVYNNGQGIATIVGKRSTAGEAWCKNTLPCLTYGNDKYYAHTEHQLIETDYEPTYNDGGYIYSECSVCGYSEKDYYADKLEEDFNSLTVIKLDKTSFTYNGKNQTPNVIIKDKIGKDLDKKYYSVSYWTVEYSSSGGCYMEAINKNEIKDVGTYMVTIDFYGKYEGYKELGFEIKPNNNTGRWIKSGNRWWYRHADGSYTKNGWEKINNKWYHFDRAGWMQTGWLKVSGKWYYLNPNGDMATGWKKVSNTWYYLNSSGAMQTGWQYINGAWYYMNSSGAMLTGWQKIGGDWYYMNSSGAMCSNQWIGNYYVNSSGRWVKTR